MLNKENQVWLSKTLSYLLRHGAQKEGLSMDSDGYVDVAHILQLPMLKRANQPPYTLENVEQIVASSDKQRFHLKQKNNRTTRWIKATQGHSVAIEDSTLEPIVDPTAPTFPAHIVHGTYSKNWPGIIQSGGLSRMSRIHIHMTTALPTDKTVVSGMRRDCELFIYINAGRALADGILFFRSMNGVILTEGNNDGILSTRYFHKVVDQKGNTIFP